MLFAIVLISLVLDGTSGTTHSTTMDLISEIQLGPRSLFGLYQDPVSKAALLDPNLDSNGPLDQIRQQVDLGFATLSCRNRDHQGKFDFLLALSKSEVDTRLLVSHDSYLAHDCFLLEDPACLLGPE